jgi:penicillin-insensitive murein endopeptidase
VADVAGDVCSCGEVFSRDNRKRDHVVEKVVKRVPLAGVLAIGLAVVALGATAGAVAIGAVPTAKQLFGHVATPTAGPTRSIGGYAKGCLAGAAPLPLDGPNWQVMRLSRNRNWGNPELIAYLEQLSSDAARVGWPGLLIGDMSMPRGGPMPTGHASHQIGLDADIWFVPMPNRTLSRDEREKMSAVSLLMTGRLSVDPAKWSAAVPRLLKQAASYPDVARIFVSAAIKKQLCETAGTDRAWLRKLRPWWGHDDHFHVRLACPSGAAGCDDQEPVGPGDGCGAELDAWFKPPPPPPKVPKPPKPKPELTLADLPKACSQILADPGVPVAPLEAVATKPAAITPSQSQN